MMWQTDELRIVRPEPTDEARTAMHYLRSLADQVVPDLLAELDRTLAAHRRASCRRDARPLRFGAWAGGDRDGNPNVTPAVTLEVIGLQHDAGLARARREARGHAPRAVVLDPLRRRSPTRCARASSATRRRCRSPTPRSVGSTPRSPTGSSSSFVRVRLLRTRDRLAHGTAHEPGRDYADLRRAARRPRAHPRLDARRRRHA